MKEESAARHVSYTRLSYAAMREVQEDVSISPSLSLNLMYFVEKIMFQKKNFVEEVAWPSGLWGKHPEFASV